jgi:hypothetical protein
MTNMSLTVNDLFNSHWRKLKRLPNVVGFEGILRPKEIDEKPSKEWSAWRIYVDVKVPESKLRPKDIIPKSLPVLKHSTISTDVKAIGRPVIPPLLGAKNLYNTGRHRPLLSGISAMHEKGTACTLNGFFLYEPESGEIFVVDASNWHCYAMEGKAVKGDKLLQPSPHDGGKIPDDIHSKFEFGVPINFDTFACPYRNFVMRKLAFWNLFRPVAAVNDVDISFGRTEVAFEKNKLCEFDEYFGGAADPVEKDKIAKDGRTTGHTEGVNESVHLNTQCQYSRGIAFMSDCVLSKLECAGGDSGSPMYKPDHPPIYNAALFGGTDQGYSVGCKISNILKRAPVKFIIKSKGQFKLVSLSDIYKVQGST